MVSAAPKHNFMYFTSVSNFAFLVVELAKLLASHVEKSNNKRSIVIYPNSGEQWDAAAQSWIPGTGCTNPKDVAHLIQKAIHSIDNQTNLIVGGCCRTSTDTIATLRKLL